MLITLDKFGRVLIPKKMRETMGLVKESQVNLKYEENKIVIENVEKSPFMEKDGLLVFTGKLDANWNDLIKSQRKKRMNNVLGVKE